MQNFGYNSVREPRKKLVLTQTKGIFLDLSFVIQILGGTSGAKDKNLNFINTVPSETKNTILQAGIFKNYEFA